MLMLFNRSGAIDHITGYADKAACQTAGAAWEAAIPRQYAGSAPSYRDQVAWVCIPGAGVQVN